MEEVFVLLGVFCLYASAETQYITSSEIIVSRTKGSLLVAVKFWRDMNFPYQAGVLLLAKSINWPSGGHARYHSCICPHLQCASSNIRLPPISSTFIFIFNLRQDAKHSSFKRSLAKNKCQKCPILAWTNCPLVITLPHIYSWAQPTTTGRLPLPRRIVFFWFFFFFFSIFF